MPQRPAPPTTLTRTVPGMNCQGCVKRMREAILAEDATAEVTGFPADKRLEVTTTLSMTALDDALAQAGYPPSELAPPAVDDTKTEAEGNDSTAAARIAASPWAVRSKAAFTTRGTGPGDSSQAARASRGRPARRLLRTPSIKSPCSNQISCKSRSSCMH